MSSRCNFPFKQTLIGSLVPLSFGTLDHSKYFRRTSGIALRFVNKSRTSRIGRAFLLQISFSLSTARFGSRKVISLNEHSFLVRQCDVVFFHVSNLVVGLQGRNCSCIRRDSSFNSRHLGIAEAGVEFHSGKAATVRSSPHGCSALVATAPEIAEASDRINKAIRRHIGGSLDYAGRNRSSILIGLRATQIAEHAPSRRRLADRTMGQPAVPPTLWSRGI